MNNTYTVQPGDTLSQLSQRYNVPQQSITGYSSGNPNLIRVGEQLHLPPDSANTSTSQGPVYTPPPHQPMQPAQHMAPQSTPQPNFLSGATNWAQTAVKNASRTIAPPAYAEQPQQENPPPRKTFNVSAHPTAVSTPGFVDGTPDWVKPMIQNASEKYNVPTALLSALIKQESNFNPSAVSPVGAQGIAQFMPETAQGMGVDTTDPNSSISGAAKYLRGSWDKFGSPELALAAYNAGGSAVNQYGGIPPYKETQNYVKNIMGMAGEIHQSAHGPYLDTVKEMKKQSENQNKIGKQTKPQNTFAFNSPVPMNQVLGAQVSPADSAIQRIRKARPNANITDQQIRQLYAKYGERLLSEL